MPRPAVPQHAGFIGCRSIIVKRSERLMFVRHLILAAIVLAAAGTAYAAHPLITDDAATQGKGKLQLEFVGEYGHDSDQEVTTNSFIATAMPVVSYGVADPIDLVFSMPYERIDTDVDGTNSGEEGIADASLQIKWRFYEKDGLSFAIKPGITLPTGDEAKGLGNGAVSYSAFFIATKAAAPWAFHANAGYLRNEYRLQEDQETKRNDLWHVSVAAQAEVVKKLNLVADIGMERNVDPSSSRNPAFILGGVIYSLNDSLDIDFGIKKGLNEPETDRTYLAGITWRI